MTLKDHKLAWLKIAAYYSKDISEAQLGMYAADTCDMKVDIERAFMTYRRSPKGHNFPLPKDLEDAIRPLITDDDVARDVSSRIIGAVSKFGYSSPDRAKAHMGELGWRAVVQMHGSWASLCQTLTESNKSNIQAQLRDLVGTLNRRKKSGHNLDRPLDESQRSLPSGAPDPAKLLRSMDDGENG